MAAAQQDLNIYRYPYQKLENNEDYLKIECLEYIPPGLGDTFGISNFALPSSDDTYRTKGKSVIRGTIILPIPENLPEVGNSVSWGESTMGPLAAGAIKVGTETINNGPIEGFKALFNTGAKVLEAAQTGIGQRTIVSGLAGKAAQQLLGQEGNTDLLNDVIGRQTGSVFNENVELLFRGINLREAFNFTFEITPRFKAEAEQVKQMILFLKREMAAKKGNTTGAAAGLFLTAPSVFKIQYMSGGKPHPYLNQFKICAMPSLSVNYSASNTYATYSDGTPVHMQLSLSFRELTPIYDQDYTNPVGTGY